MIGGKASFGGCFVTGMDGGNGGGQKVSRPDGSKGCEWGLF